MSENARPQNEQQGAGPADKIAAWLASPLAERGHVLLITGGRRGGKATLAVDALCRYKQAHKLASTVVCQPNAEHMEKLAVCEIPPVHSPEALKRGTADVVVLCHADEMSARAFAWAMWSVAARGGVVVVAANPPASKDGAWLGDIYKGIYSGALKGSIVTMPSPPMSNSARDVLYALAPSLGVAEADLVGTWK